MIMIEICYFPLKERHIEEATHIYTEAFLSDPFTKYILPDPMTRYPFLDTLFRAMIIYNVRYGEIYGIGEPIQGIAAWTSPKPTSKKINFIDYLKCGFGNIIFSRFLFTWVKILQTQHYTKNFLEKYVNQPCIILDLIAVNPEVHGKGFASKLIKPILFLAQKQKIPVYLETSNPDNIEIYEHFGFRLREKANIKNNSYSIYIFTKNDYNDNIN